MRRRTIIAAALGIPVAALPAWAAPAAATPDPDRLLIKNASWEAAYEEIQRQLDLLGTRYVTHEGALDRHTIMDSGMWLYAEAAELAKRASLAQTRKAHRLSAECAAFTAGCYVDFGNMTAAAEMYRQANGQCGEGNADLKAFIATQANWVPMYSGNWRSVLDRSERIVGQAERHGGYGLLMAYTHLARANAVLGNANAARAAAFAAQSNIHRVPGARSGQSSALMYSETKVWFSSSTVYAELGDREAQKEAYAAAVVDPKIGWIDRNLMELGRRQLEPDPEEAAYHVRLQMLKLPVDAFNACVRAEGLRVVAKLKAKQLIRYGTAQKQVKMLNSYLHSVKTDVAA